MLVILGMIPGYLQIAYPIDHILEGFACVPALACTRAPGRGERGNKPPATVAERHVEGNRETAREVHDLVQPNDLQLLKKAPSSAEENNTDSCACMHERTELNLVVGILPTSTFLLRTEINVIKKRLILRASPAAIDGRDCALRGTRLFAFGSPRSWSKSIIAEVFGFWAQATFGRVAPIRAAEGQR